MPEAALIVCAVTWSSSYFFMKYAVSMIHPLELLAYRFALGSLCLFPFIIPKLSRTRECLSSGIICGTVLFLLLLPLGQALISGSVTNAGFIMSLFVVFVPVFSFFFTGTRLRRIDYGAVLLSLLGLWILTGGISELGKSDLLYLLGAFGCTFHVLFTERAATKGLDLILISFIQCVVVATLSFASLYIFGISAHALQANVIPSLAFLGIISSALCIVLQLYGQRSVSAWRSCLIFATEPLLTVLIAWWIFNEKVTLWTLVGGVLIVGATLLPGYQSSVTKEI